MTLASLLCIATVAPHDFEAWLKVHNRTYSTYAEHRRRLAYFEINQAAVAAVAAAAPLATYDMLADPFADFSQEEFAAQRPVVAPSLFGHAQAQAPFSEAAVRAAGPIDWVAKGAVTPPISQGRCGTCAQFSATANIEAQWFLAGHPLVPLAVQEMIDCSSYTGPYGMGWVADVHKGLDRAADYPLANHSDPTLKGCRSPCNMSEANHSLARIDGATCAGGTFKDDEAQMMAWLQHGPLSVSVAAGAFNGYRGGIISGAACNDTHVDHAVLLVGYGEDKGVKYWKLKNSWGPAFGEGGYVRVQHGVHCLGLRGACQSYIGKPPVA